MPSYIAWNSSYLIGYGYGAADQTRLEAHIEAASAAVDRFTNRGFNLVERDQIFYNRTGQIMLPAYPVESVARVLTTGVDALTLTGPAPVATFSVTSAALKLVKIVGGTRTNTSLAFATYPTLGTLAAAVGSGWSATVATGYDDYPSTDLVEGQSGTAAGTAQPLRLWSESAGAYEVDTDRGIVSLRGHYSHNWLADLDTWGPEKIRIVWTGGYSTIPADIQEIVAKITANLTDNKAGNVSSESLGEYSYTLAASAVSQLPLNMKQTLASYKSRGV